MVACNYHASLVSSNFMAGNAHLLLLKACSTFWKASLHLYNHLSLSLVHHFLIILEQKEDLSEGIRQRTL